MRVTNLKYIGFGVLVEAFRWIPMLTHLYILIERGTDLLIFF
jgi:hypothetical protein